MIPLAFLLNTSDVIVSKLLTKKEWLIVFSGDVLYYFLLVIQASA